MHHSTYIFHPAHHEPHLVTIARLYNVGRALRIYGRRIAPANSEGNVQLLKDRSRWFCCNITTITHPQPGNPRSGPRQSHVAFLSPPQNFTTLPMIFALGYVCGVLSCYCLHACLNGSRPTSNDGQRMHMDRGSNLSSPQLFILYPSFTTRLW